MSNGRNDAPMIVDVLGRAWERQDGIRNLARRRMGLSLPAQPATRSSAKRSESSVRCVAPRRRAPESDRPRRRKCSERQNHIIHDGDGARTRQRLPHGHPHRWHEGALVCSRTATASSRRSAAKAVPGTTPGVMSPAQDCAEESPRRHPRHAPAMGVANGGARGAADG